MWIFPAIQLECDSWAYSSKDSAIHMHVDVNKKLCDHRGTARRAMSDKTFSAAAYLRKTTF